MYGGTRTHTRALCVTSYPIFELFIYMLEGFTVLVVLLSFGFVAKSQTESETIQLISWVHSRNIGVPNTISRINLQTEIHQILLDDDNCN